MKVNLPGPVTCHNLPIYFIFISQIQFVDSDDEVEKLCATVVNTNLLWKAQQLFSYINLWK